MNEAPTADQLATASWCKSSYSAADNECVEIAHVMPQVAIRDSKAPAHGTLLLPHVAFTAFIKALKA